jgi:Domain of unknown function (DUF4303)
MGHQLEELQIQIASAVRQAAAELRSHKSELFGFALCTDDDVRTLYHIACTRDWVRENEVDYPDIGFIYVEWTHSAANAPFDAISRQFSHLADASYASDADWVAARDARFNLLVSALRDCREAGAFAPDTLLCAGSTDPSEHLEALTMSGVDAVNTADIADQFARALGYENHRT